MNAILKMELRRAIINKMFLIALGIGICIAIVQLVFVVVPYGIGEGWQMWRAGSKGSYPFSVYNTWIGSTSYSIFTTLYFFILPLIVCLPYADSLYSDITSGYSTNIVVRVGATRYFAAKSLAIFLSAGAVSMIPLVVNFAATALFVPFLIPEPVAGTFPVAPSAMLSDLFYTVPLGYVGFFGVLTFFIAGIIALLCLVFSHLLANRFMVLVAPFLLSAISYFVLVEAGLAGYSPINLLLPAQPFHVELNWVLSVYAFIVILSVSYITWRALSYEAL